MTTYAITNHEALLEQIQQMYRTEDLHGVQAFDFDPYHERPTTYSTDETPWMRADPHLMAWIQRQGLDPKDVREFFTWDEAWTVATFEIILRDPAGKALLDPRTRDEVLTGDRIVILWGDPPPYRTPDGRVLT